MKHIFILAITILFFSCAAPSQQVVDAATFEQHIKKPEVQLLDVRTAAEFKDGHIKEALQADWTNQEQFKERVKYLDKNRPIAVYCLSGGRSGQAAQWLLANGFKNVENLKGGFTAWKQENKPIQGATNVAQITTENYNAYISSSNIVLIDFSANWCPPCKQMAPVIEALKNEQKNKLKVIQLDGGVNTNVMQQLKVEALPTFIIYKNGKETWRKQGVVTKEEFVTYLNSL